MKEVSKIAGETTVNVRKLKDPASRKVLMQAN